MIAIEHEHPYLRHNPRRIAAKGGAQRKSQNGEQLDVISAILLHLISGRIGDQSSERKRYLLPIERPPCRAEHVNDLLIYSFAVRFSDNGIELLKLIGTYSVTNRISLIEREKSKGEHI